jgi:hypothetical protein
LLGRSSQPMLAALASKLVTDFQAALGFELGSTELKWYSNQGSGP